VDARPTISRAISLVMACLLATLGAAAQRGEIRITGDRLSGVVLPVEPIAADIELIALRAFAWEVDDTRRLILEQDVVIRIGQFEFISDQAAVWLNRIPSADGLINQIAVYFDEVQDPTRQAGMGASGRRLLVTGSARGAVRLNVSLVERRKRAEEGLLKRAESRLAEHLREITAAQPDLMQYPQSHADPPPEQPTLTPGGVPPEAPVDHPDRLTLPPVEGADYPLFDPRGSISLNAASIEVIPGELENVIIADGAIVIEYADDRGGDEWSRLTISAERGVVFTKPGPISEVPSLAMEAGFVLGAYLEGNVVATDGEYTVRGTRVYYDVERQQAIMLDGVLRTFSREVGRPIYARAEEFRQISSQQWTMGRASVSTSEFFTPHLAIGASRVRVEQRPGELDGTRRTETYIESKDNTIRLGGVPVAYWPHLAGTVQDIPLKNIQVSSRDNMGVGIETEWDVYALLGLAPPDGIDLRAEADVFTERGFGLGLEFEYDFADTEGLVDLYGLFDARGEDRSSAGVDVDVDREFRGIGLWENQTRLSEALTVQAQVSYITDPTFVTAFLEDDFAERREYETSLYLRHLDGHTAWTVLGKRPLNDFISNGWLLASRAYTVEKLPELTYRRYGDKLFDDAVTYSSEYRYSRLSMAFNETTPAEIGLRARAFGIDDDDARIDDLLEARGLPSSIVNRLDTRHELSIPGKWGDVNVTPFVVGRATWYDQAFDEFSSDSDDLRLFAGAGLRLSTVFQRIDNSIESRLFDLHRVRHLVEPSILLWYGWSDVDQSDLPVFDEAVESLATGSAVRFGLLNTWQTHRGGPGFWESVDFLTIDAGLVLASGDTDLEHPVPQFFEYRPEYSILADHVELTTVWAVSDGLSLVSESIYDLEETRIARGAVGALLQHSPTFTTFVEFRYIDASDNELLGVDWQYQVTPVYRLGLRPQWDFREDEFRSIRFEVTRSFPDFDFTVGVRRDEIRGDTSLSAGMRLTEF